MSIENIINNIIKESSWTKARIARLLGKTPQSINDRLSTKKKKALGVNTAMEMLDLLGYEMLVVPKGTRLPQGAYRVTFEDVAEK